MKTTIPKLIAHRGYAEHYPENTLLALEKAVEAGAKYLEIDIQLTCDEVPVLFHDESLLRTTGKAGNITEKTLTELDQYHPSEATRFDRKFGDILIPTLNQTIQWLNQNPSLTLLIELKEESIHRFGITTLLKRVIDATKSAHQQCILISYNVDFLAAAKNNFPTGWVLKQYDNSHHKTALALQPDYLICNYTKLPDGCRQLWPGDWQWAFYEVTKKEVAMRLAQQGASFIETMSVSTMINALKS